MNSKEYLKQIATTEVIDCTNNDKAKKRIANIFPVGISAIEKDLEVLEIIKTKNFDILVAVEEYIFNLLKYIELNSFCK